MSLMNEYAAPAAGFPAARGERSSSKVTWLLVAAVLATVAALQRWLAPDWWGVTDVGASPTFRGLLTMSSPVLIWTSELQIALWAAMMGGMGLALSGVTLRAQVVAAALCVSPAMVLALSGGGLEAFAFLLCAAAVRANERYPLLTASLIALGFFIAVYPVLLLAILDTRSREGRRALWLALSVVAICVLSVVTTNGAVSWNPLSASTTDIGFGVMAVSDWVAEVHPRWFRTAMLFQVCGLVAPVVLAAMWRAAAMPLLGRKFSEQLFLAGALWHVGAFVCGVNTCDRLIGLVLCVPWLVERSRRYRVLNAMAVLIALALWQLKLVNVVGGGDYLSEDRVFVLRQMVNWTVFVVLATVVGADLFARGEAWLSDRRRARAGG